MAGAIDEQFLGCWRLVGVEREDAVTGEQLDVGMRQSGYISYTPDGRMMVIIARHKPDADDEITCYAARWHVKGEHVIHDIDLAARAPWKGTKQVRGFRFEGNRLVLSPPVSEDFLHGKVTRRSLTWERV
ncbi:MAG: lipocalin-like domain-containing protein [Beijerinckiaceae bacterium]